MSRSHLVVLPFAVTLLAACGAPSGGEVKSPAPEGSSTASANTPAPTATESESAAPKSTAAPKTAAAPDDKKGPYEGVNPGKTVAITGDEAWTLGPYPDYSNELGSYQFVRSEGTRNVFKKFGSDDEFSMPAAFTFKPKAQKLKKGDRVFATVVTSGVCALVTSVKDDKPTVTFFWGDKASTREMDAENLVLFDGTLGFASSVYWEEGDEDNREVQHAHLVYKDEKDAYLTFEKKVPVKDLHAVDVKQPLKAGQKVLAAPFDTSSSLQPGTIVKVLEDGLAFEVRLDDSPKETTKTSYCDIIPAPKPAKKK